MKCANCGAEIRLGCVYCPVCGKEAQIVSDYNLLEDDFLRDVLKEKEQEAFEKGAASPKAKKAAKAKDGKKEVSKAKAAKKRSLKWPIVAIVALLVLVAGLILAVRLKNENSYDYQMEQAGQYQKSKDYGRAKKCLDRALKLQEDSLDARFMLAEISLSQGNEDDAKSMLEEILKIDGKNKEAYRQLIGIYADEKDYDAVIALSDGVTDAELLALFDDYLTDTPVLTPDGGNFQQETEVRISGEEGSAIYYTKDGSDPKQGATYIGPISVMPGEDVTIRAIACNEFGIYSEEASGEFWVERQKPGPPKVTPDGGNFYGPQTISIYVPEGCDAYYTWDGTVPTESSARYTQPIAVPEGNNILSVALFDSYGMRSDVVKCNYIYMP